MAEVLKSSKCFHLLGCDYGVRNWGRKVSAIWRSLCAVNHETIGNDSGLLPFVHIVKVCVTRGVYFRRFHCITIVIMQHCYIWDFQGGTLTLN